MSDARQKQIKIKTGVVKRLTKEVGAYEKEAITQQSRIEKMKAEKKDEYEIKKQIEVLQESNMMVPDCLRRLETALNDLNTLLSTEKDLVETEDYKSALQIIEDARIVVKNSSYKA